MLSHSPIHRLPLQKQMVSRFCPVYLDTLSDWIGQNSTTVGGVFYASVIRYLYRKILLKEFATNKNLLVLIGVMIVVGFLSALLTYLRADIASKGVAAVQKGNIVFFGVVMPLVVGIITFFVYRGILARSADAAQTSFLLLSIGVAVVLSILAAVVFKMRGFVELSTLHVLYVAGFGWIIPMLWAR